MLVMYVIQLVDNDSYQLLAWNHCHVFDS